MPSFQNSKAGTNVGGSFENFTLVGKEKKSFKKMALKKQVKLAQSLNDKTEITRQVQISHHRRWF